MPVIQSKIKESEKYITFVDQNILHKDFLKRGHKINDKMVEKYFLSLRNYLSNLKKKFHKEVVICLHPSSNYHLYKRNLRKFKICKYETDKHILHSFLILFHDSTAIFSAMLLKKKIISLKSNIRGPYAEARRHYILKKIPLIYHDIDQDIKIKKKELTYKLNNKVKNYEKIINKIYYTDKSSLPIEKIIDDEIQKLWNNKGQFK